MSARVPSLWWPLGIMGLVGGWVTAGVLHHPVVYVTDSHHPVVAASAAGALAALVGGWLQRSARTGLASLSRLTVGLLLSGALTGLVVGLATGLARPPLDYPDPGGSLWHACASGAGVGFVASLPLLPLCWVILRAAERSSRARRGSLVAASDARVVWTANAIAVALVASAAALDWTAALSQRWAAPVLPLGMAALAGLVCAGAFLVDTLALAEAKRARALLARLHQMDPRSADVRSATDAVPGLLDLGLGEELGASIESNQGAYRSNARPVPRIRGNPDHACRALRRNALVGGLGLVTALVVVATHLYVKGPAGAASLEGVRCEGGELPACRRAALFSIAAGDLTAAHDWISRTCHPDHKLCAFPVALELAERGGPPDVVREVALDEIACREGARDACGRALRVSMPTHVATR